MPADAESPYLPVTVRHTDITEEGFMITEIDWEETLSSLPRGE